MSFPDLTDAALCRAHYATMMALASDPHADLMEQCEYLRAMAHRIDAGELLAERYPELLKIVFSDLAQTSHDWARRHEPDPNRMVELAKQALRFCRRSESIPGTYIRPELLARIQNLLRQLGVSGEELELA